MARGKPKKGPGPSLIVQRMRESGWTDTAPNITLEGLSPYDAFHDPRCPRALRLIFNEQQKAKTRKRDKPIAIKQPRCEAEKQASPSTRPIVDPVPLEAPGLPLLVASTTKQHGGPGVTYEKIGAGYATELDVVRLALRRNDCLRRAHEIVERREKRKKKVQETSLDEDDELVRAIKERDGKVKKGPPKGLKKVVEELRVLTRKVAGLLAQRRSLLGDAAPSFDLGGQPYVLTMLSDVEFLEDYGRYLDYETARRNPLLLPHAHPGFDDLRGDDFVPSVLQSKRAVVQLPHYYGANTDAEKQLLTELRAMPRGTIHQYIDEEQARTKTIAYEPPPPTVEKIEEAPVTVTQASFFQSTASDRTTSAQRHLEFTRAEQRRGRRRQRESEKLLKEFEEKLKTLKGKKNDLQSSISGPPSFKQSVRIAKLDSAISDLDKKRREKAKTIYFEREALVRRDRRIRELERDVQREEEERAERRAERLQLEAAKSPVVAAPAPSLEMFSPTILRQSVSLEPSALLTASLDVQPEPSALTGSVDEAPSRLLRFEDSDFAEQPLKARFAPVSAEPSALFTASLDPAAMPSALTSSLQETTDDSASEVERLRAQLAESTSFRDDSEAAHAAEVARLSEMLAQRDRALRDESVTLHGAEISRLQEELSHFQDQLAEREASEAQRLQNQLDESLQTAKSESEADSSKAHAAEIESLKAALKEREDAARREAERLRREKEELEDKTLKMQTILAQQEREARMACEERDAAKRLLAEKQRAALSPEPSALSLNPEDSELEGGATVGPQATVYTQTAQFEPLEAVADEGSTASSTIVRAVHPERAVSSPPPGTPMLLDEDPDVEAQLLAYGLVPPGRTRPRPSAVSFAEDDETSASTSTGRPPLARSQTWSVASAPPPASWELGSMTPLGR